MAMSEAGGPHSTPETNTHAPRSGGLAHAHAQGRALTLDARSLPGNWVRNWASQDWIAVSYLTLLLVALMIGKGPNRIDCIEKVLGDLGFFFAVLALVRGNVLRWGSMASSLVYRVSIIVTLLAAHFEFLLRFRVISQR